MKTSTHPHYTVAFSAGGCDATAEVTIDRKNRSVHLHLYGDMFEGRKTKTEVRTYETPFLDIDDRDAVREIMMGLISGKDMQIKKIVKRRSVVDRRSGVKSPKRIIVRFGK
ncbi:MAG TPA: hypothetical protein VFE50_08120 [Cyclobacteriaceae bacterium]|nr:hypothetical protein [Cyclobacteriaceae bacterium]